MECGMKSVSYVFLLISIVPNMSLVAMYEDSYQRLPISIKNLEGAEIAKNVDKESGIPDGEICTKNLLETLEKEGFNFSALNSTKKTPLGAQSQKYMVDVNDEINTQDQEYFPEILKFVNNNQDKHANDIKNEIKIAVNDLKPADEKLKTALAFLGFCGSFACGAIISGTIIFTALIVQKYNLI